jgi:hypothetical protein
MGQFKPMVKMYTTEPSVELKLKKGGHVKTSKMKVKEHDGHKMMDGGVPPMAMPARGGLPTAAAPMKPSLAMRRKAMRAMPSAAAPAGPVGMAGRIMKKGGSCEEMIQEHADKPASKAHKGLKKGGDCYATGGVAMGQGGYKKGGKVKMAEGGVPKSGIINTEGQGGKYRTTKMDTAEYTTKTSGKTGEVKNGNGGGYKKGGRCYADGGKVMNYVDGNVVGTPAGKTNTTTGGVKLGNAGGFKKGGATKKAADGGKKGKPAVKGRARRYADGGDVTAYSGYDDDQGGMTMDDSDFVNPQVMYAMGSGKDMGVDPRVIRGQVGMQPNPMERIPKRLNVQNRVTTQGPGDGLAPRPTFMNSPQAAAAIKAKLMGNPKIAGIGPGDLPIYNAPVRKPMQSILSPQRSNNSAMVSGSAKTAPMGLPTPGPTGRVGLPNVAPTGRIADPQQAMMAQQPSQPAKYAKGGSVQDDGRAVKMPKPRVPTPVSINQLSGTYKKGGRVK